LRLFVLGPRIFGFRLGAIFSPQDLLSNGAPRRRRAPELIYVIAMTGTRMIKVGVSGDPLARMAQLQPASPTPLRLAYAAAARSGDATAVEQRAHARLAAYRAAGEWFDVSEGLAVAAIAESSHFLGDPIVQIKEHDLAYAIARARAEEAQAQPPARGGIRTALRILAGGLVAYAVLMAALVALAWTNQGL
jgi:hypothetical protein